MEWLLPLCALYSQFQSHVLSWHLLLERTVRNYREPAVCQVLCWTLSLPSQSARFMGETLFFVCLAVLGFRCGKWASLSGCGSWAGLPCGMWDLSSLTRDQTLVPCIGKQILNHWTTREVPGKTLLNTRNHNDHNEGALGRGTGSCLRPGLFWSAHLVQSSRCHTGPGTRWVLSNMHREDG